MITMKSLILYWIVGFRPGFGYFLVFWSSLLVLGLLCIMYAITVAAPFPSAVSANLFSIFIVSFFVLFGGNFSNTLGVSWVIRWMNYMSPLFYSFRVLVQNELAGQVYDKGLTGDAYLARNGLDQVSINDCIAILFGMIGLFSITGYGLLFFFTRPKFITMSRK